MTTRHFLALYPPKGRYLAALLALAFSIVIAGCAHKQLELSDAQDDLEPALGRIQTISEKNVTIQVSIPTDVVASQFFGVELAKHDIQPVWIRVQNHSDTDYWLLPIAIDPDYYSADEAALVTANGLPEKAWVQIRRKFRTHALPFFSPAGTVHEGYVYASHKVGGRFVDVRLSGHLRAIRMRFAMLLPTEAFDYERSGLRQRYAEVDTLDNLSPAEFREQLRTMPCCTSDASNTGEGDPLNIVLVGTAADVVAALTASGWDFTEAITIDSIMRMIGAAVAEQSFIYAPVSALYAFGRKQDIAMQRGRSTINQRNHMRLWLAPFRVEGIPVWVGQVSRDIGVKITAKSPTLTTHVIDPVVDEAREYLMHSLLHHDAIERFAFVQGVGRATEEEPRKNLTDDTYFTDGMRMVLWLSRVPVEPHRAIDLGWNESADPIRESQGKQHMVPALLDE